MTANLQFWAEPGCDLGRSAASVGDQDGDGHADLLLGMPHSGAFGSYDPANTAWVILFADLR